jgi:hypothetical protein
LSMTVIRTVKRAMNRTENVTVDGAANRTIIRAVSRVVHTTGE